MAIQMDPEINLPDDERGQMGEGIARCLEERDFDGLARFFHPQVACRLLIPAGLLTPTGTPALIGRLRQWFGDADHLIMESRQITRVGASLHLGYRIRLREDGLPYTVEQQTYSKLEGDRITQFDLICSGFQPDPRANL